MDNIDTGNGNLRSVGRGLCLVGYGSRSRRESREDVYRVEGE